MLKRSSISLGLWLHCVDDVFVVWRDNEDFTSFSHQVNGLSESIEFITEWERDDKLLFIDVNINRPSFRSHIFYLS